MPSVGWIEGHKSRSLPYLPRNIPFFYYCFFIPGGCPSAWPWLHIWFKSLVSAAEFSDLMGKQFMGVPIV